MLFLYLQHSNTTLVNVKLIMKESMEELNKNSNTTLVNVKLNSSLLLYIIC